MCRKNEPTVIHVFFSSCLFRDVSVFLFLFVFFSDKNNQTNNLGSFCLCFSYSCCSFPGKKKKGVRRVFRLFLFFTAPTIYRKIRFRPPFVTFFFFSFFLHFRHFLFLFCTRILGGVVVICRRSERVLHLLDEVKGLHFRFV